VNYPDPQLGGSTQVLKGALHAKDKDKMLLTELLAKGRLLESFDIKKTADDAGVSTYEATPKDKKFNLKSVTLVVKNQDKELRRLDYVDDVGNKTSLNILAEKIQADSRPQLFKFAPQKGDQVSNL
jgi:outer membrane lipoprotein-sorting protein